MLSDYNIALGVESSDTVDNVRQTILEVESSNTIDNVKARIQDEHVSDIHTP